MKVEKFTLLLFLISVALCACNSEKGSSKRTKSLQGFENAIPLGEIEAEKPVSPSPSPSPLPKDENLNDAGLETGVVENSKTLDELISEEETDTGIQKNSEKDSNKDTNELDKTKKQNQLLDSSFKLIKKFNSKIISLEQEDETLYLSTRYQISSLREGNEEIILNQEIFKKTFNQEMPAIATIHKTKENGLWIGFTNGYIVQFENNKLNLKTGGPAQKKQRIEIIKEIDGRIFIGGKGFYEWDKKFDRFMSNDELKNEIITGISKLDNDNLIFSTQSSVFLMSLRDRSSKKLYQSFTGDYPIKSLLTSNKYILIGGRQGFLVLNFSGAPQSRFGTKYSITKTIQIKDNGHLSIDNNENLHLIKDEKIELSSKKVKNTTSFSSGSEALFFGLENGEVYEIKYADFVSHLKKNSINVIKNFTKDYPSACDAAEELLKSKFYSHQISAPIVDKKRYVFFNNNQVCPSNAGYMRFDGYTVILNTNNEIELFEFNKRKSIKLPSSVLRDDITKIFLDSSNTIYLGTKKGLHFLQDSHWNQVKESPELEADHVTAILEDKRKNIWVTTRIKNIKSDQIENTEYRPLHIKVSSGDWASFGKKNGISAFGISAIKEHPDGIYFSNPRGYFVITNNSKLKYYSQGQGIKNYIVENLNFGNSNRLWLAHGYFQNGLSWIDQTTYYNASKEDGLFSNRIIDIAEDDNDLVWIMDSSGKTNVSSYDVLENIAKKSPFHPNRVSTGDFLP